MGDLPLEQVYLHPYSIFLIQPLAGGPIFLLPLVSLLTMTFLLMNYPHHCPSMILWLYCNETAYHTPTSFLLAGAILQIFIAKNRLANCVPREVH